MFVIVEEGQPGTSKKLFGSHDVVCAGHVILPTLSCPFHLRDILRQVLREVSTVSTRKLAIGHSIKFSSTIFFPFSIASSRKVIHQKARSNTASVC